MQTSVPDTFFSSPPHFRWLIVLYFFIGGLAGGALVLASLMRLFGRAEDRPLVHLASEVALAGAVLSAIILTVDLTRPLRFWHMVIQNHTGLPMFKWWSPMSVGVWGLLVFGVFALVAWLGALADQGRTRWGVARAAANPAVAAIGAVGGMAAGLFLAGYTGVLLAVSNRPIWADSSWLGVLFLFSGVSTAIAALLLGARWRGLELPSTIAWLVRFDRITLALEAIALVCFVVSLGAVARALVNGWGALLVLGVLGMGVLLPLGMEWRPRIHGAQRMALAAACVLVGGFLLRAAVLLSSEQVRVLGTHVIR
ncbi:MAG TPA: NrfD/PsrC family molybdoenzyme membrane anchor subunit [Gemmatimonadaceae bacterium]